MPRRRDDVRMTSQDRRTGSSGPDPYSISSSRGGRGGGGRSGEAHPLDGLEGGSGGGRSKGGKEYPRTRTGSIERWERVYDGYDDDDVMLSSSPPPVERVVRRSHVDDRLYHSSPKSTVIYDKCEHGEYLDRNEMKIRSKNPVGYDEFVGQRSEFSGHRSFPQNSMPVDDMHGEVRMHTSYLSTSRYGEEGTVDAHRFRDENARYQDASPRENLSKDMYLKDGERYGYYSRGGSYVEPPVSEVKEFENEDFQSFGQGTSSSIPARGVCSSKVRDGHALPSHGHPKSFVRGIDSQMDDGYDPRTISGARRSYELAVRDAQCSCDAYASAKSGYIDNCPETRHRIIDDPSYTHRGNLPTKMAYVHEEHDRSPARPKVMDATAEYRREAEAPYYSRRTIKNYGVREFQKETAQGYVGTRRPTNELNQAREYKDYGYSHVEYTKKVSKHQHSPEFCGLSEHENEDPHLCYEYGRCAPARSDGTRMKSLPEVKSDIELQRDVESGRTEVEEPVAYERVLKRKYTMDNDMSRVDSRSVVPSKFCATRHYDNDVYEVECTSGEFVAGHSSRSSKYYDYDDYSVEYTDGKSVAGHSSRSSKYDQSNYYTEGEQMSEEIYHHKDSVNVGWKSFANQLDDLREDSGKPIKGRYGAPKGYPKSESSKYYSHMPHSHESHQKSNHYKHHNLGHRNVDDHLMTGHGQDIDLQKDNTDSWKVDPSEGSEGFKQKVQAAFLDFSKRFNENPTARKLYKEQGKAGNLFCVVCRRSASKEFQDTRALASHAFMSRKPGSRALHLGLHKAICVLMGWKIAPTSDSSTWIPEALPRSEALVLKEDLILWPPLVIIHNISLSSNDHKEWKLINIDTLGDFLRAKGFSLGKMKICLGNPGDHSVILVKFLSTFSGLQEAERLHKHFVDRKHGRVDFDEAITNIEKTGVGEGSNESDKQLEDELLYGYMGISDDMDKVDFDTKKKCSVKSKKEIHDLADAPVKPE